MGNLFDPKRILQTTLTTKRFWMPVFLLVVFAVNAAVLFMPKKYRAEATVVIHAPQLTNMTGAAGNLLSVRDRLETIREEITSFSFLEEIARKLNLTMGLQPNSVAYEMRVRGMVKNIVLRVKNTDLFSLSYVAGTPQEAYNVTNEIVKLYLSNSSRLIEAKTESLQKFTQTELDQAERELTVAQDQVTAYKNANINEIPEAQARNVSQLHDLRQQRAAAENQLSGLRQVLKVQREKLSQMEKEVVTERVVQASPEMQGLTRKKAELESQLQFLLAEFTDKHWQVKEAQKALELVTKQLADAEASQVEQETKTTNPQFVALQDLIAATEFKISELETNVVRYKSDIEQFEAWMAKMPQHQLELERLESARRIAADKVNTLRKALDQARITAQIEAKGQGPTFELQDPPRVPPAPFSPNRFKFAALSIAAGAAAAAAIIFLLMLLDSAVRSVDEARRMLQMPILGVVQRIVTGSEEIRLRQRRLRRIWGFSATATMLILVIVVGLVFYREPLQSGVESIRSLFGQR